MIELLVVITIIAVLVGISYAVLADTLVKARVEATRATIRQLDSALQERVESLARINLRTQADELVLRYNSYTGSPANDPAFMPAEVARIIVRKDRYRGALPQRLEDTWGLDGVPGGIVPGDMDDSPLWGAWIAHHAEEAAKRPTATPAPTIPSPAAPRPPNMLLNRDGRDLENIELLVFALTEAGTFAGTPLPLDSLNPDHVRDTAIDWNDDGSVTDATYPGGDDLDGDGFADGNGIPEVYDDWGEPLRFYNWPTRLIRFGGETSTPPTVPATFAGIDASDFSASALALIPDAPKTIVDLAFTDYSHPLNQDPDDQTGALTAAQNATDPGIGRQSFGLAGRPNLAQPITEGFYHTFDTWHVPLIVSAGDDEELGLNDPALTGSAPERLGQISDPADLDFLYDNITNRQR